MTTTRGVVKRPGPRAAWRAACLAAATLASTLAAAADVYWFTDEDGGVHLSNVPSGSHFRRLLEDPSSPPAETAPGGARVAPTPRAARGAGTPATGTWRGAAAYGELIDRAAQAAQLEGALLRAVIAVESAFDPLAISPKGAGGLMQLMPATARRYGVVDTFDPAQNVRGGARYLKDLLRMFGGDLTLALAAYNAGEASVVRHGNAIPPFRETQQYVPKVLALYRHYQGAR